VVAIVMTASVGAEPAGTGFGAKVQLASAGNPEQVKFKAATVAGFGVSRMWLMPDWPAVMVIAPRVGAIAKSPPELIVNDLGPLVAAL
jgi:hypothetical protein